MEAKRLRLWTRILVPCVLFSLLGCTDPTGRNQDKLPAGVPDPKTFDNPAGALALYQYTICSFYSCQETADGSLKQAALVGGLFSDELQSNRLGRSAVEVELDGPGFEWSLDARQVTEVDYSLNGGGGNGVYSSLHIGRRNARLAAAALRKHGSEMSPALRGHMFVLEGYAEILLGDLYCSGVPLSTVDFEADYTYQPGSTTQAVYVHAITLFDSALAMSSDSTRILNLARVGKARALLNLGRYADAAQVAASVPSGFVYQFTVKWATGTVGGFTARKITVSNREGGTGLPYRSSRDPRTAVVRYGTNTATRDTLWFPSKYGTQTSLSAMTLADAVEARLIEAEAALHESDLTTWLARLNALRTDGTFIVSPNATDPTRVDTLWHAGTGGVAGLAPLRDPGADLSDPVNTEMRIDLLFAERAAWMFLTGHRQGDLRRLVRPRSLGGYERKEDTVYPTGPYAGGPLLPRFGRDVTLVIPSEEFQNPYYTGCQGRGA